MKKIAMLGFVFLIHLLFIYPAYAETPAESLQRKLNTLRTMSASFKQVIRAKTRVVSRSSGTMALQRPGKFRWKTKSPMEQLVVADGSKLWVYDVDLDQVTVKKQGKGLGGTPALFLGGVSNTVTRDFVVIKSVEGPLEHYDLRPKADSSASQDSFQQVRLDFVGDALRSIELFDQLGQQTHVELLNVQVNPKLAASLFSFKPPKGVDVVRQ